MQNARVSVPLAKSGKEMSSGEPDERAVMVANFATRLCALMWWYDIRFVREPGKTGIGWPITCSSSALFSRAWTSSHFGEHSAAGPVISRA